MTKIRNYLTGKYSSLWVAPLLLLLIMTACENRMGFVATPIVTTPTVSAINPENLAISVPFNQKITATFSEAMDPVTITSATFTLMKGSSLISGVISNTGNTWIFTPANNLAANTNYTAMISTGAKNLAGTCLENNMVWVFTTGTDALVMLPTVSSTDPSNAATNVPLNQKIAASFSVAMNASDLTSATFTLKKGTVPVPGFVSYSGTTALFTPTSNLTANTTYEIMISSEIRDLAGNSLVNDYVSTFTTGATTVTTPPVVNSTDPANSATNVVMNQKIAAIFNKTMNPATFTSATFTLKQGSTPIPGFVSYSGKSARFAPTGVLTASTVYTATITTGVQDLFGNTMSSNYVWSFTTGAAVIITSPVVSSTNPANLATDVALNQKVAVTFNKSMDASTITTATLILKRGTTPVPSFTSYSGLTAIIAPLSNLAPNVVYTATVTTGATDLAGNALENNYVWSFTTGAAAIIVPPIVRSTDPIDGATGVDFNKHISVIFSKTMDVSTITTSNFTLMQGSTFVSGTVNHTDTVATYVPASNLMPNTTYTVTITTGAKDLAGNSLAGNYVWSFTTDAAAVIVPPTVLSTDPVDAATGVAFNKHIGVIFSKTMDNATITTSTFTLMQGATFVAGTVNHTDTGAMYVPSSSLMSNMTYTATITTGAKDLAGNTLASNYVWSFTTIVPYNVALSSNPLAGGSTSESNVFNSGSLVKISAIPNSGYTFTNWKEGMAIVSTDSNYEFTITANRTLVATFTPIGYAVSLTSIPSVGGTVYSAGSFLPGTLVTVNTTSNPGYMFSNWTKDGVIVSTNANYSFTVNGDSSLVANFVTGQMPLVLGSAARFAILSDQAITNIPTSDIRGDVGLTAGVRSMMDFTLGDPQVTLGGTYAADDAAPTPAMLIAAKADAVVGYLDAVNALRGTPIPASGNLNGLTLVPGLYESGTSMELSPGGILYLDAMGDSNAVFVFRSATTITTESTSDVVLTNNAKAKNIYWAAGSAITLGTNSRMKGTLIASTSISLLTGARLDGRALIQGAAAGQVSLDQNIIVLP